MKKTLLFLLINLTVSSASSQITTPVIKANFGIDADVRANYFNGVINSAGDDWFNNGTAGTGQFVIDTSGAAAIVANYTTTPATRMNPFSRLMKQAPYSLVNNRLVMDAIFQRDFHGTDSTVFASGSNKNGMSPSLWSCPVAQNIPDKNDILDVFTHIRRAGPNVTDSLWMFGGISIQNTNGNRYFDFELYQTDISYNRTNRVFNSYGSDAGHTSWLFDAAGNVLRAGDIIFSAEFGSSTLTLIEARIWIKKSSLSVNPVNFNWGGLFDGDGAAAAYGYASILPKTAGAFYTGIQSANGTWAGPFALVQQDNSVVANYAANQFMEISVNLTKLGIDPGNFSNNPCGTPFRRVLIKTRASTSFTSELKDFVAPFKLFDYPSVLAYTEFIYFCRVFPPTTIYVYNPNPTSIYTWSTTNGHIVGSNTGTSVVVDAPGTYKVTQQLHVQCLLYSVDSIVMLFDSACVVLDANLVNFNGKIINNKVELKWRVLNNKEVNNFEIEYSYDNMNFIRLTDLDANDKINMADYLFSHSLFTANNPVIFYRIKINGKNGSIKYSKTIAVRSSNLANSDIIVFPNPTHGETWLAYKGNKNEITTVPIWDQQGKLIVNTTLEIHTGDNFIRLPDLSEKPAGIYLLKIKLGNEQIIKKIIKLN